MLSPALLVVFVISPARVESTVLPFEQAAHEVLGPHAELRVQEVASMPSDAAALERAGSADGVVELSWNAARQTAALHCYIASEQRWVDRTVHFRAADPEPDRGRLLGLAVATMFSDAPGFAREDALVQPSIEPMPAAASAAVSPSAPIAVPAAHDAQGSAAFDGAPSGPVPAHEEVGGARTVEFAGVAASELGTAETLELGAVAALGVPLLRALSVRIQLEGREGEIAAAQAVVRRLIGGVGLAWNVLPDTSPVELRIRASGLGSWFQVSHLSDDDAASVTNHGWLLGGDAVATLGYRVSRHLTLSAGLGFEAMLGETHVFTHGVERATLPAYRGLGELGLVAHF